MRRFCIVVLATLALSVYSANIDPSACDCGYIDAADPSKNVYTDLFYFDFTNSSSPDVLSKFRYADYTVSRQSSPYARKYLPSLASVDDDGLHLKVTANVQSGAVESALSSTKNKNYRYGSYQMTGRVTNVTGTVSAFFIYHDDSSEVDMEYVSSDTSQMMRYSVKPQQYLDNGAAAATTYQTEPWNNGSFSDTAHTWSFLWTPDRVDYGLDFNYTKSITTNVPSEAGLIVVSHWSDGNPSYSMGPPLDDSQFLIKSLWAVHNSSADKALPCQKSKLACTVSSPAYSAQNSTEDAVVKGTYASSGSRVSYAPFFLGLSLETILSVAALLLALLVDGAFLL